MKNHANKKSIGVRSPETNMHSILREADTWFYESLNFNYPDTLEIIIVEGIKGKDKEPVDDTDLGPYYPVHVTEKSQCLQITFPGIISYNTVNESYDQTEREYLADIEGGTLSPLKNSSYFDHAREHILFEIIDDDIFHYQLWTEDAVFYIISTEEATVNELSKKPDLSIERHKTYFAY